MRLLIALSLSWLPCLMGSPGNDPYGYAPYIWIAVSTCRAQTATAASL